MVSETSQPAAAHSKTKTNRIGRRVLFTRSFSEIHSQNTEQIDDEGGPDHHHHKAIKQALHASGIRFFGIGCIHFRQRTKAARA